MSGSLATKQNSAGVGLSASDYRKILQGLYPVDGIIKGGTVSGNVGLTYHVSETIANISNGGDGTRIAYYPGGDTPAVSAGDASNSRIDAVWLKANDPDLDNDSSEVVIGVTQGTPSANPVAPSIETGKLRLANMLVLPSVTNMATGSSVASKKNYSIPYGAQLGRIGYGSNNDTVPQDMKDRWYLQNFCDVTVPTDRLVDVRWTGRASNDDSSYYLKCVVDGVDISDGLDEMTVFDTWERKQFVYTPILTAGTHRVAMYAKPNLGKKQFTWRGIRTVEVFDRGVSA